MVLIPTKVHTKIARGPIVITALAVLISLSKAIARCPLLISVWLPLKYAP